MSYYPPQPISVPVYAVGYPPATGEPMVLSSSPQEQLPFPEAYVPGVGNSSFPGYGSAPVMPGEQPPGYYTVVPRHHHHGRHHHHHHHRHPSSGSGRLTPRSYTYSGRESSSSLSSSSYAPHDYSQDGSNTYDKVFGSDSDDEDYNYGRPHDYDYHDSASAGPVVPLSHSPSQSIYSGSSSAGGYQVQGPNGEITDLAFEAIRRVLSRFIDEKYLTGEDNGIARVAEYMLKYGLEQVLNHTLGDGEEHRRMGRIARYMLKYGLQAVTNHMTARGVEDGPSHHQVAEDALRRGFDAYSSGRYGAERGMSYDTGGSHYPVYSYSY